MNLENVTLENDRRCSVDDLRPLMRKLPIKIRGTEDLELKARMTLGAKVKIQPTKGNIESVEFYRGSITPMTLLTDECEFYLEDNVI